jgi:hypothetical protein
MKTYGGVDLPYQILKNLPSGLGDDAMSDRIGGRTDRNDVIKIGSRISDLTFYRNHSSGSKGTKWHRKYTVFIIPEFIRCTKKRVFIVNNMYFSFFSPAFD